eukprot:CAMPEP_0203773290 /NCGR_PEP_ID=MMETSP0099_2-20121227/4570_1 /ASSEMBLY_ACC=CAM_ASM_000209 /TAXON_ID=96639 /ORGANISM=" , Strain NY0313808BC1" /LENGTH=479 /DNA_ID=CAMNT_0050671093 /DNA_START=242 /DNA_END=1681 /DNA_ORIENTATION=+
MRSSSTNSCWGSPKGVLVCVGVASGVAALGWLAFGLCMRKGKCAPEFEKRVPRESGKAARFTVMDVKKHGGAVFSDNLEQISAVDDGCEVCVGEVLSNEDMMVYCIDSIVDPASGEYRTIVCFVDIQDKEKLWTEAFLDRGIRQWIRPNSKAYLVTVDTLVDYIAKNGLDDDIRSGSKELSFVWNTGRCGSTLMHKVLLASRKVCSFSEPMWLDQITRGNKAFSYVSSADEWARIIRALVVCDIALSPKHLKQCKYISYNPKAFTTYEAMEYVFKAFENDAQPLKHMYMYRKAAGVVNSFGSLFLGSRSRFERFLLYLISPVTVGLMKMKHKYSSSLQKSVEQEGPIPLPSSSIVVAKIAAGWLNNVQYWCDMSTSRRELERALIVRFDEITDKSKQRAIVSKVFEQFYSCNEPDVINSAMEAFNTDSQKGSSMSSKTKRVEALSVADRKALVEATKRIRGPVQVDPKGNILIEGSLQA